MKTLTETPPVRLSDDEFFALFSSNQNGVRYERDAKGVIFAMPPVSDYVGRLTSEICTDVNIWRRKVREGFAYTGETGFVLPNTALRSPDVAWVSDETDRTIPADKRNKFAPVCPDFVVELRSPSDSLKDQQNKMTEWIENGCRLGWLIDPVDEQVFVYRENGSMDCLQGLNHRLSGEKVLKDFVLDLGAIVESLKR